MLTTKLLAQLKAAPLRVMAASITSASDYVPMSNGEKGTRMHSTMLSKQSSGWMARSVLNSSLNKVSMRSFSSSPRNMSVSEVSKIIDGLRDNDNDEENSHIVNEYFRVNFRKLSFDDAIKLLKSSHDVYALEDKFWVWEALEEAIRPTIFEISDERFDEVTKFFTKMRKGSRYFYSDLADRFGSRQKLF